MVFNALALETNEHTKPIRVITVGTDDNPATEQDIIDIQNYLQNHDTLPDDWPQKWGMYKVNRYPLPGTLVIKLGSSNRPPTPTDIHEVTEQLRQVIDDPCLTIVTHHCFKMEWVEKGKALVLINLTPRVEEVYGIL